MNPEREEALSADGNAAKRVLHLRSSGGMLGAENVVLELAKQSPAFGYEAVVGALKNAEDPVPEFIAAARALGLRTKVFECDGSFDFHTASHIKQFVRDHNVKVLHCHGYKEDVFGLLARTGTPKIATNHLWKTSTIKARGYCLIDALLIRFYDRVVGVSDEIVKAMAAVGVKGAFKIANGIDCDLFNARPREDSFAEKYNLFPDDCVLGMISSLSYEKNHQAALNALKGIDNPKLKLLIVGKGHLEKELRSQVEELGLSERVVFTGALSDISEVLSVVDVFVLPSLSEGLPMALLEAMAAGKAVVASCVGEVGNVIEHHVNGLLVESNNVEDLRSAIEFLSEDRAKAVKYGRAARRTVQENFSSAIMAQNYCKVYDSMLSSVVSGGRSG